MTDYNPDETWKTLSDTYMTLYLAAADLPKSKYRAHVLESMEDFLNDLRAACFMPEGIEKYRESMVTS